MAIDAYAPCPCGSGKKFKWCCQPIHAEIEKAFELHNAQQFEAALQAMQEVVAAHAGNPEVHGRHAQLLALNGKADEAEAALERAFAINPQYGFGYLLRGQFRLQEGELLGALLLFRKAADAYATDATDPLAYAYELIADIELRLNRPMAAAAAFRRAVHVLPANAELRQSYEQLFGEKSRLPECARREYTFRSPTKPIDGLAATLERASTGKLTDAREAFTTWTKDHPGDPAGWFNLGLARAWLGDNQGSIEAMSKSGELDDDDSRAEEAYAICEVLRCGDGLVDSCDYAEHRGFMPVRDPQVLLALIETWGQGRRLVGMRADPEQGVLTGLLLEPPSSLVETADGPAFAKLRAYLMVAGNTLQLWTSDGEALDAALEEVKKAIGAAESQKMTGPVMFHDVLVGAMIYPTRQTTELDATAKIREAAGAFFEDKWLHQPLKSLGGIAPVDAAAHPGTRRKLAGTVRFLEDCAAPTSVKLYDFNRLRRKLGLAAGAVVTEGGAVDVTTLGISELASLDVSGFNSAQLAEAFRAAITLDAKDLAGKFARQLVASEGPAGEDRYAFFQHLIGLAQAEKDWDDGLEWVEAGEKYDCEHNEGRRRNDYELRRGQLLAKRGDSAGAADVFERLVARQPDELKYLESATKAMLDLKNPKAAGFAEQGLSKARAQNNRDAEEYFKELADAASRLK
ncbi:MAG: tetratricopeptide repeat protein [Gemmataceae bacterium]|nr:tetratricopeptide repeat protein [Gemmataceae bacterium]